MHGLWIVGRVINVVRVLISILCAWSTKYKMGKKNQTTVLNIPIRQTGDLP